MAEQLPIGERRLNVNQLHRALGKLIEAGHGRKPVAINSSTFFVLHEEDGNIVNVAECEGPTFVCTVDDDGWTKYNKDGSEAGRQFVILRGSKKP